MQDALHTGTWHTDFSIHRGFCTKIVWQRETCTHRRCDHTHTLLTQHTWTHKGTEKAKVFCRQRHFKLKCFTQKNNPLLCVSCFPRKCFHTQTNKIVFHTQKLLHEEASTQTLFHPFCLHTDSRQTLLHPFFLHTEKNLFTRKGECGADTFTRNRVSTQTVFLHEHTRCCC